MDNQAVAYLRTLVFAALLGLPVAAAAVLFQTAIHDVIHFVWEVVPEWLDWSEPAGWYVVVVTGLAGVAVALFVRLPGHGGHAPLEGISVGMSGQSSCRGSSWRRWPRSAAASSSGRRRR